MLGFFFFAGADHNMFTDMRPSERQDARDALAEKAKQYELAPEDEYNGDPIYGCLEDDELAPWVLAKFAARGPRWRQRKKDEFDTLEEANRAAKDIVEHCLSTRIPRVFSSFTHVADGDRDIEEYDIEPELYGVEPKPGKDYLDKYEAQPSDTEAKLVETTDDGLQAYTANYFVYCDPYGADVYNVVKVTLTCRVEAIEK